MIDLLDVPPVLWSAEDCERAAIEIREKRAALEALIVEDQLVVRLRKVVDASHAYHKALIANNAADFTGNENEHRAYLAMEGARRAWITALREDNT